MQGTVTFARQSVFEREAVVDERRILRDAMRRGMGETTNREIRTEFEARRIVGDFKVVELQNIVLAEDSPRRRRCR